MILSDQDKVFVIQPNGYWQCIRLNSCGGGGGNEEEESNTLGTSLMINLGSKLGKVQTSRLLECPAYDYYYDLEDDQFLDHKPIPVSTSNYGDEELNDEEENGQVGTIKKIKIDQEISDGQEIGGMLPNDTIFDDNTAQSLTREQIMALKLEGTQTLITNLVQGSESFALKNAYAQTKYLKRKQAKYARIIKLIASTPLNAIRLLTSQSKQAKLGYLRLDSFAQICLLAGNSLPINQTGKCLVFDECSQGLLAAELVLNKNAEMVVCSYKDRQQPNFGFLETLLSNVVKVKGRLYPLSLDSIVQSVYPDPALDSHPQYVQRWQRYHRAHQMAHSTGFDVLIICLQDSNNLQTIFDQLTKFLKPSGRLIIYVPGHECQLRRLFLDLLQFRRFRGKGKTVEEEEKEGGNRGAATDDNGDDEDDKKRNSTKISIKNEGKPFVDVQMWTTFTREYQTEPGRLHPQMTMNTMNGGIILSAFKVIS